MEQKTKKKKRRVLNVLLIILGVIVVIIAAFLIFILGGKSRAMNLTLDKITAASVADGVYTGSYSGMRFSNTVEVTVKDHRITDIKVVKEQAIINPETAQALADEVLKAQSTDVDAVSGATATTKAFLKAVENALESATKS
jgi:uncharacterized protein with FMN-binding domain